MNNSLLMNANRYKKQRKWQKAIKYYEQYLNTSTNSEVTAHVSYAKCLKMNGQTTDALHILNDTEKQWPNQEAVLKEKYNLYAFINKYKNAKHIGQQLIQLNKENPDFYFKTGRASASLKQKTEAEEYYKKGLEHKHNQPLSEIQHEIQQSITSKTEEVDSTFVFYQGKNNYGMFTHVYHGKKYITKIFNNTKSARREAAFLKYVSSHSPVLNNIIPSLKQVHIKDNVQYLTMEKIDIQRCNKSFQHIIEASNVITSIPYHDALAIKRNPTYPFTLKSLSASAFVFFTEIHQEKYNRKLFDALEMMIQQRNYPEEAYSIISRLREIILDQKLFDFIEPEKHYSLLHGDFISSNIVLDVEHKLYVIDWATFTTGPRFMDIVRYAVGTKIPFETFSKQYLDNPALRFSNIEKIFCLYAYIILYFVILKNKKNRINETLRSFIEPAMQKTEILGNKMQETNQKKNITIGMMRHFRKPNAVVTAAAHAAKMNDCEFYFFNPDQVDIENKRIDAIYYYDGAWHKKNIPFPDVIDNSPSNKSSRSVYERLEAMVPLTTRRIGNKDKISNRLLKEKQYHHLIIPFHHIRTKHDIIQFIDKHNSVVIKPRGGNRGKNIYFANKENGQYIIKKSNESFSLNDETEQMKRILQGNYVVQKYIHSTTKNENAFDVRIHIRRSEGGNWTVVKMYPRIGAEGSYTSNVSQGGSIGNITSFLTAQFPRRYKQIKNQLNTLAKEFPIYFQKAYAKPVDAIGLDVGIDKGGKIWLFEVNSYPGSTSFELESQTAAMRYAKYLAHHRELVIQND